MKPNLRLTMATCPAYRLDKELRKAMEYLEEQVRAPKKQQEKNKRILGGMTPAGRCFRRVMA